MKFTRTQKLFMWSGGIWAIYDAFTAAFLSLFALALGASNLQIGLIGAVPYLAAILAEIPGAKLVEYFTRKSISIAAISTRAFWIPLLLAPFISENYAVFFIIILIFLIKFFDIISDPAWTSFIADVVPAKIRGFYFGRRFLIIGLFSAFATIVGGFFLKLFPKESTLGFSILFFLGAVIGLSNIFILKKADEPDYIDHDHHKLKEFFTLKGDFRRYAFFMFFFNFAFMIGSPFFTVYLIKNLSLSYEFFGIATAIATISKIFANKYIGLVADKIGDKPIMIASAFGIALVPLLYLFATPANVWIIIPAQIISGIFWAGIDLASFNLLLDFSNPKKRAVQIAEFNFICAFPLAIAPVVGGVIVDNYSFFLRGIPLIFAVTGILRALSPLLLIGIKEPRIPHSYSLVQLFRETLSVLPLAGISQRMKVAFKRNRKK